MIAGDGKLTWRRRGAPVYDGTGITAYYEGEMRSGKPHGQGRIWHRSGASYRGGWRDGRMSGSGHLSFANGRDYSGLFREGRFHGKGELTERDGSVTVAVFSDGQAKMIVERRPPPTNIEFFVRSDRERAGGHLGTAGSATNSRIVQVQTGNYANARIGLNVKYTFPEGYEPSPSCSPRTPCGRPVLR